MIVMNEKQVTLLSHRYECTTSVKLISHMFQVRHRAAKCWACKQRFTYIEPSVDPQCGIEKDVVKELLEQRSSRFQSHEIFRQLEEGVQYLYCYVIP
jgi:transcriptional regulator NrdR family protein